MSAVDAAIAEAAADAYNAIPAMNWSNLKHIAVSPRMFRYRQEHPEERKQAFVFGGAVHCKILEPEKFDKRYAVYEGKRDARAKDWQTWQAVNPGVEALKPHELERVEACAQAVLEDRDASKLLQGGRREEALTWTDELTGMPCKGRLDYIRPDLFVDLKTARDPSPAKFQRAAIEYGYAPQVAFYHDGAVQARRIPADSLPYVVAVQNKGCFDVVSFQLTPAMLEYGCMVYRALLRRLRECMDADLWPGVAPGLQQLDVPPWAEQRVQAFAEEQEDF